MKPVDCGTGFLDYSTMWDVYKTQLPLVLSTQPQVARRMMDDMLKVSAELGFFPLTQMMTKGKGRDNGQAAALATYTLADAFFRVGYVAKDWDPARERVPRVGFFEGLNNESDMETPYTYVWAGRPDRMAEVLDAIRRYRSTDARSGSRGSPSTGSSAAARSSSALPTVRPPSRSPCRRGWTSSRT